MLHDIVDILPSFMIRPSNVPEGAHIQWEIELLSFETPRVFFPIVQLNSCYLLKQLHICIYLL